MCYVLTINYSDRPLLLRDSNSIVIAAAFPPPLDQSEVAAMTEELRILDDVGSSDIHEKRGGFKFVKHGLQRGGGIMVSDSTSN